MKNLLDLERQKPDYVAEPHELMGISASLAILVKDTADKLERLYPGWLWTLNPDENAGMLYLYSLRLSGEFGYKFRIGEIENDEKRKFAMRAGGELLERYGCPRKRYKHKYLKGLMLDIRGNYIPDLTDRSQKEQKVNRDRTVTKALNEGSIRFRAHDTTQEDGSVHRELFVQIGGDDDADQAG